MKKNLTITSAAAAILVLGGCGQAADEAQWTDNGGRYCVDDDGDAVPVSYCDNSNSGYGGAFVFIGSSHYKSKYPSKYKSYSSKVASSRNASSRSTSRGIGGGSARSYSSGSIGA